MRNIKKLVKDNPDKLFNIEGFGDLMGLDDTLYKEGMAIMRKTVGDKYHYLNSYETMKLINKEPDQRKRDQMMRDLMSELEKVLNQLSNLDKRKW
jgi:hypothetical protein